LGLCVFAQLVASGAAAQTEEISQVRADRDALREERARAAADLDPLMAANEQIEEAMRILQEDLAAKQTELAATEAQLERAKLEVAELELQGQQAQQDIVDLRDQLARQAITAYVQPEADSADEVLRSGDLNEGERRRALVSAVQRSGTDILDELRQAEADLELATIRAEQVEQDIVNRQRLVAVQQAEVEEAIANQAALAAVLEARIAEFTAEVDELDAAEAALQNELTTLIVEEEARQEAIREAARIAAERERVAREEAERARLAAEARARGEAPQVAVVDRSQANLVSAPSVGNGTITWPVQGTVTSRFGPRWGRQHNGIDVAANTGTTIVASASGTVIASGSVAGFGRRVIIDHGGGFVTLYAHMNSINATTGQFVNPGTAIGTVGCTGSCTGPHLHFETRVNGVAYDPFNYLGG